MTRGHNTTLRVFDPAEMARAKHLLATEVAGMMGRKLEEGDWAKVYCRAKGIPLGGWSNLHIDVDHEGLGVEHKLLRCPGLKGRPIKSVCGTTLMHPAATRSIRIDDAERSAAAVMEDVLAQYGELIRRRTEKVRANAGGREPDMRIGWLLWEDGLTEFLYFEQPLAVPSAGDYYAEWNETPARGARKSSRSLWIYERRTDKKRFSVTTSAGIKIQPYFDVPSPTDPNLCYFRVQGESVDDRTVRIWLSVATAHALRRHIGGLDRARVDTAVARAASVAALGQGAATGDEDGLAKPVLLTKSAYEMLCATWEGVSDEHRVQLLLETLYRADGRGGA